MARGAVRIARSNGSWSQKLDGSGTQISGTYDPVMGRGLLTIGLVIVLVGYAVAARRVRQAKRSRARTAELVIDADGVSRTLADGRSESVRWIDVTEVEVVCTPVTTADGADAFVVLTGVAGTGCLVPLGVGWDDRLVVGLGRLERFDWRQWSEASGHSPPKRTVVWAGGGQAAGAGSATDTE